MNGLLVDDQYEHNSGDVIENRLLWPSVQRTDLNSVFTCQAVNTLLVEPKESSFVMDLHREYYYDERGKHNLTYKNMHQHAPTQI